MAVFYEQNLKNMHKVLENPDALKSISTSKINEGGLASRLKTVSASRDLEVEDPSLGLSPAPELIKEWKNIKAIQIMLNGLDKI